MPDRVRRSVLLALIRPESCLIRMSYCFNQACENPQNPDEAEFCLSCHSQMLLRNRYRAIDYIEEGNFGRTLLAKDADRFDAPCIIKQFFKWRKLESHAEAMARATQIFEKEAKLLLQLGTHPQIPTLLACFEQDKRLYIVQEYIDGQNLLEELLEQGVFSEQKIWDLLNELLPVLKFIHEHGVIHRDIKPMNIIRRQSDSSSETQPCDNAFGVSDRSLVLVDFGLAKHLNGTEAGKTGSRYGTEGYAPIEQTRGKVYLASDLYSLGVTCIQLLTGTGLANLYDAEQGIWLWRDYLRQHGTDVSDRLSQILDKLIKDSLKERYQSATQVLKDLQDDLLRWRCIYTFSGHLGRVNKVTFNRDGQTVVSGSDDQTVKVWHLSSGQLIQSVDSQSQGVNFAVISPDEQTVASGGQENTIQLWNMATQQLLYSLGGHAGVVRQVVFTPDGQTLISGSEDSTIKLWNLSNGKLLNTLIGHSGAIRAVVVSPDGKILASGSEDKTIKLWHLGSGIVLHTLTEHSNRVNSLTISSDGQTLASGSADNTIKIWHLSNGKLIDTLWGHTEPVRSVAFSPDGQTLASGSDDRTIKLWQRYIDFRF